MRGTRLQLPEIVAKHFQNISVKEKKKKKIPNGLWENQNQMLAEKKIILLKHSFQSENGFAGNVSSSLTIAEGRCVHGP